MPQDAIVVNKFTGLNNVLSDYGKKLDVLLQAINVDVDDDLRLRSRKGSDKVFAGSVHSIWGGSEICLFRNGEHLKSLNVLNYTPATLRSGLSTDPIQMHYLELLGKIYYSDGKVTGIIENTVNRSWGLSAPPMAALSSIAGNLSSGTYQVTVTYVRNDGQESGNSVPSVISVGDNAGIQAIIEPSADTDVSKIKVYMTEPNGNVFFLATIVDNEGQAVSLTEVNNLTSILQTLNLSAPPAGELLRFWNGRIWVVVNNTLWFTEPYSYELCNKSKNYITFEHPIHTVIPLDNGVWVGTDKKTYFIAGDEPPFGIKTEFNFGVLHAVQETVPGYIINPKIQGEVGIWLSDAGLCMGTSDGSLLNLTDQIYSFPSALAGHSLYRESDGMNQILMWLKESGEYPNAYRAFTNSVNTNLPLLTANGATL